MYQFLSLSYCGNSSSSFSWKEHLLPYLCMCTDALLLFQERRLGFDFRPGEAVRGTVPAHLQWRAAWSCHVQQGLDCQSRSDFVFRTCSLLRPRSLFLMISDQYFIFSKRVESFACLSLCQYSLSIANSSLADICSRKFLDIVKTQPWWALCPVQLWKLRPSPRHQRAPPSQLRGSASAARSSPPVSRPSAT